MSIARIKPSGWAPNEALKLSQLNQMDLNLVRSFDKRGDTLLGPLLVSSSGAIDGYGPIVSNGGSVNMNTTGNVACSAASSLSFPASTLAGLSIAGESTIDAMNVTGDVAVSNTSVAIDSLTAYYLELGNRLKVTPVTGNAFGSIMRVECSPPVSYTYASPTSYFGSLAWMVSLGAYPLHHPLNVPRNDGTWLSNKLLSVRAYFRPTSRAVLPATPATFKIVAFNRTSGFTATISNVISDDPDDYGDSLDVYASYRSVQVSVLPAFQAVNSSYDYALIVTSDVTGDPELAASFLYFGAEVELSVSQLDPC